MISSLSALWKRLFYQAFKRDFSGFLEVFTDACIYVTVALLPVWFLPFTSGVIDFNKQAFLFVLVLMACVSWIGHGLLTRSFSLTRGWLHLVVLFLLGGYAVISVFSQDRYRSFVGEGNQVQWSLLTLVGFGLLYFLIVNRSRERSQVYSLLRAFLFGSILAGLYGLFQLFGLHLFGGVFANTAFNTVGTVGGLGVFLAIPIVLAMALLVLEHGAMRFWRLMYWVVLAVGLFYAFAIDHWAVWVGLFLGAILMLILLFVRRDTTPSIFARALPAAVAALCVLFFFLPAPSFLPVTVPLEVMPSMNSTWDIARSALRDRPLVGSGPGTWFFDYARYRPIDVNASPFWNTRFEQGFSAVLTGIGSVGVIGIALFALLLVSGVAQGARLLLREKNMDAWRISSVIFVGWFMTVILAFLYPYQISHQLAFWLLLALLASQLNHDEWRLEDARFLKVKGWFSAFFILIVFVAITLGWLIGQRYFADVRYVQADQSFQRQEPLDQAVGLLTEAVALNPLSDTYHRTLSQAHLLMARSGMSENSGIDVQAHITAAVTHAMHSVQISPRNVDNWASAASLYEAMMGMVPGAEVEAMARYQEALKYDPHSPLLMNGVGKTFLFRAAAASRALDASPDASSQEQLRTDLNLMLQNAEAWFTRALQAKPDYVPAAFNLGTVYDRSGRMDEAIGVVERIRESFPDNMNARWFLADLYERAHRYDDAIAEIQAIAERRPDLPEVADRLKALNDAKAAFVAPEASP